MRHLLPVKFLHNLHLPHCKFTVFSCSNTIIHYHDKEHWDKTLPLVPKVMGMIFCAAQKGQERIVAVVVDGGGTQVYSLTLLS